MTLTKVSFSMIAGSIANVKDYGAVCNGSHDDTAAINAALAANTTVNLSGISAISGPIIVPVGSTLLGSNNDGLVSLGTTAFTMLVLNRGVTVDGFTIDARSFTSGSIDIVSLVGWDAIEPLQQRLSVTNLRILGGPPPNLFNQAIGITVEPTATNYSIVDFAVFDNIYIYGFRDGLVINASGAAPNINFCNGNQFTNLNIVQCFRMIRLVNTALAGAINSGNVSIAGNFFSGVTQHYTGLQYSIFCNGAQTNQFNFIHNDFPSGYHYLFDVTSKSNQIISSTTLPKDVFDQSGSTNRAYARDTPWVSLLYNGISAMSFGGYGASISKIGTGQYQLTFDIATTNVNYLVNLSANLLSVNRDAQISYTNKTTNGFIIQVYSSSTTNFYDVSDISIIVFNATYN